MSTIKLPETVKIVDVGPRDGLQNEAEFVSTANKIALVHMLEDAGLREIEVTSFVSPRWVPQMADAAEVMAGIRRHVDVADTIGVGTPRKVRAAMEMALEHFPLAETSGHFHDTYGQALANIYECLLLGVHSFDTSVAGLGGCPYAKGATGNVATEDVVYLLQGLGIETGIDLDKLIDAGKFISDFLGRKPNSRAATAILNKRAA